VPSLAWKNLIEDRGRLAVALAGIMFAVALIAIQTGIYAGFVKSAGLLIDESSADIWVCAQDMRYVELTLPIPYADLDKAQHVAGVAAAEPMVVRTSAFKGPAHRLELIRVVGFDPDGTLFRPGPVSDADVHKLRAKNTFLVDRANLSAMNLHGIGDTGQIGDTTLRLVALTQGTQPIVSATLIYTSLPNERTYLQLAPAIDTKSFNPLAVYFGFPVAALDALGPDTSLSYLLIRVKPGAEISKVQKDLERALPGTDAYTKEQMGDVTKTYWEKRTGLGFILGLGAVVGIIVGMAVVGQILYTSVSDHIREYGTMKAMGASDWTLHKIIITQAVLMAVIGFLPGILVSEWVAAFAMAQRGLLVLISPAVALQALAITVGMCVFSAVFAMQRVTRVDPAVVFKA
jgi:putative ABC transport system permease protein